MLVTNEALAIADAASTCQGEKSAISDVEAGNVDARSTAIISAVDITVQATRRRLLSEHAAAALRACFNWSRCGVVQSEALFLADVAPQILTASGFPRHSFVALRAVEGSALVDVAPNISWEAEERCRAARRHLEPFMRRHAEGLCRTGRPPPTATRGAALVLSGNVSSVARGIESRALRFIGTSLFCAPRNEHHRRDDDDAAAGVIAFRQPPCRLPAQKTRPSPHDRPLRTLCITACVAVAFDPLTGGRKTSPQRINHDATACFLASGGRRHRQGDLRFAADGFGGMPSAIDMLSMASFMVAARHGFDAPSSLHFPVAAPRLLPRAHR